jgi:hypothetical protein
MVISLSSMVVTGGCSRARRVGRLSRLGRHVSVVASMQRVQPTRERSSVQPGYASCSFAERSCDVEGAAPGMAAPRRP